MCIAAVRLSRRRTWHISCARTASNWAGVRRSVMPWGSNRTGLRIPNTPGSISTGEDITGIGRSSASGVAPFRATRICRQHRNHRGVWHLTVRATRLSLENAIFESASKSPPKWPAARARPTCRWKADHCSTPAEFDFGLQMLCRSRHSWEVREAAVARRPPCFRP